MDQYIKQLLLLHSKIILPEFGAIFIANEDTGELSFNEYLSYDDGKLSKLLEQESNMDLQEAQNSVAKFVRDLKLQLNKGETYSIFQLGEFSKSNDGSFVFEGNLNADTTAKKTPIVEPTPIPTPIVNDKAITEEEKKEELPKPETKKEEAIIPPVPKSKTKPVVHTEAKKNIYVEKSIGDQSIDKPDENKAPQAVIIQKEEKRRRGFLFWFLLLLLLVIISGSAFVLINYERVENYMGWTLFDKKESDSELKVEKQKPVVKKDDVVITADPDEEIVKEDEETPVETPAEAPVEVKEPVRQETTPIASTNGNHHIVIGCFGEKSNADRLVSKFQEKGFDSKIVSQAGGLYFVAAQSYPTFQAANSDLSRVRQHVEKAWLYKN